MQAAIYNKTANASFRNMHSVRQKKETLSIQDNRPEFSKQSELLKIIQGKELALPASQDVIQRRIPGLDGLKSVCDNPRYTIERIREELTTLLKNMETEGFRLTAFGGNDFVNPKTAAESLILFNGRKKVVNKPYFRQLFEPTGEKFKEYLYIAPKDAETSLRRNEKKKMKNVARIAIRGVDETLNKKHLLECIFDEKWREAYSNYESIRGVLEDIEDNQVMITTDYNEDYKQTGVKGYKSNRKPTAFNWSEAYIHFPSLSTEEPEILAITAIHECAHYINPKISDFVYSDAPGFEEADSETKIKNAAHYEVVPRWLLLGYAITASSTTSGVPVTNNASTTSNSVKGKAAAVNYFRQAHLSALNMFTTFQELYLEGEKIVENTPQTTYISCMEIPIIDNKPDLLTISVAEDIVHTILIMYYNIRDNNVVVNNLDGKKNEIKDRYIEKTLQDNLLRQLTKNQMNYLVSIP